MMSLPQLFAPRNRSGSHARISQPTERRESPLGSIHQELQLARARKSVVPCGGELSGRSGIDGRRRRV